MRSTAIALGVVVVLAASGCGGGGSGSADKSSYVQKNATLRATLPVYPGAKLIKQGTTGYTVGGGKISGYQTRYIFSLPKGSTAKTVQAYYLKNLPAAGWKQVASLTGPVDNFRKGKGFVSVILTEAASHQFELVVDDNFFAHLKK